MTTHLTASAIVFALITGSAALAQDDPVAQSTTTTRTQSNDGSVKAKKKEHIVESNGVT